MSNKGLALGGGSPLFEKPLYVGKPLDMDPRVFEQGLQSSLEMRWLTNYGPNVQAFEAQLASYLHIKHCIVLGNCTLGLMILPYLLGLEPGDEIILPSFTFIATAHAMAYQGFKLRFCEVDPLTHQIDLNHAKAMITPKTKAIVGVHLWGNTADLSALEHLASEHGLQLFFDAAHAFGCTYQGQFIGRFGRAEVLSFHATKFLSACEGGAILTQDDALAEAVRKAINFGFVDYDRVTGLGINAKMSELHAAYGLASLAKSPQNQTHLAHNYQVYRDALKDIPDFKLMTYPAEERRNFQYIVLECQIESAFTRDQWVHILHKENVIARRYFFPGCHRLEPYCTQSRVQLPVTEALSERVMVLPTGTQMTEHDIQILTAFLSEVGQNPQKVVLS